MVSPRGPEPPRILLARARAADGRSLTPCARSRIGQAEELEVLRDPGLRRLVCLTYMVGFHGFGETNTDREMR